MNCSMVPLEQRESDKDALERTQGAADTLPAANNAYQKGNAADAAAAVDDAAVDDAVNAAAAAAAAAADDNIIHNNYNHQQHNNLIMSQETWQELEEQQTVTATRIVPPAHKPTLLSPSQPDDWPQWQVHVQKQTLSEQKKRKRQQTHAWYHVQTAPSYHPRHWARACRIHKELGITNAKKRANRHNKTQHRTYDLVIRVPPHLKRLHPRIIARFQGKWCLTGNPDTLNVQTKQHNHTNSKNNENNEIRPRRFDILVAIDGNDIETLQPSALDVLLDNNLEIPLRTFTLRRWDNEQQPRPPRSRARATVAMSLIHDNANQETEQDDNGNDNDIDDDDDEEEEENDEALFLASPSKDNANELFNNDEPSVAYSSDDDSYERDVKIKKQQAEQQNKQWDNSSRDDDDDSEFEEIGDTNDDDDNVDNDEYLDPLLTNSLPNQLPKQALPTIPMAQRKAPPQAAPANLPLGNPAPVAMWAPMMQQLQRQQQHTLLSRSMLQQNGLVGHNRAANGLPMVSALTGTTQITQPTFPANTYTVTVPVQPGGKLGIEVVTKGNRVAFKGFVGDGPRPSQGAFRSSGDIIVAVDGKSVHHLSVEQIKNCLRDNAGKPSRVLTMLPQISQRAPDAV